MEKLYVSRVFPHTRCAFLVKHTHIIYILHIIYNIHTRIIFQQFSFLLHINKMSPHHVNRILSIIRGTEMSNFNIFIWGIAQLQHPIHHCFNYKDKAIHISLTEHCAIFDRALYRQVLWSSGFFPVLPGHTWVCFEALLVHLYQSAFMCVLPPYDDLSLTFSMSVQAFGMIVEDSHIKWYPNSSPGSLLY